MHTSSSGILCSQRWTSSHSSVRSLHRCSSQVSQHQKQCSPGLRRWFDYKSVTFHILFLRHRKPSGQPGNAKCAPRGGKGRIPATCVHNAPTSLHCVCILALNCSTPSRIIHRHHPWNRPVNKCKYDFFFKEFRSFVRIQGICNNVNTERTSTTISELVTYLIT